MVPEIELQLAFGGRGSFIAGEGTFLLSQINRLIDSSVVDGLEYLLVQLGSFLALEGDEQLLKNISQTLNSNADGSMPEIGISCFRNGVVVQVNDFVQVSGADSCDSHQLLDVECFVLPIYESRKGDGGQIAHCNFIFAGVFHNFSAEVA